MCLHPSKGRLNMKCSTKIIPRGLDEWWMAKGWSRRGEKKKYKCSGINDDCISIGWQRLPSLYNKLLPVFKANCPHNKCNHDIGKCVYVWLSGLILLECSTAAALQQALQKKIQVLWTDTNLLHPGFSVWLSKVKYTAVSEVNFHCLNVAKALNLALKAFHCYIN